MQSYSPRLLHHKECNHGADRARRQSGGVKSGGAGGGRQQCGGRRLDLETIGRSVALWRTDYSSALNADALQLHSAGLNLWFDRYRYEGADLALTETFLAIGVDELSVTPRSVLPLRNAVRMTDTRETSERILSELDSDYTAR